MDWQRDRIGSALRGENPTVMAELEFGFAVMGDVWFLPGYCVLLAKDPRAHALAELPRDQRIGFLTDVDTLATAVERAYATADPGFRPMNIDILGNADNFVHAHVWARYDWEPEPLRSWPVWLYDPASWRDSATALGPQYDALRTAITAELHRFT